MGTSPVITPCYVYFSQDVIGEIGNAICVESGVIPSLCDTTKQS